MITEKQKIGLKKMLGDSHISKIAKYLVGQKIFNRNGYPYTSIFISEILNGHKANQKIEDAIFAAADNHLVELAEEQDRRNKILGIDESSSK